jgi:predicted porin
MKKSLWAIAALGTFAASAHAQSSATLYGIIDAGLVYTTNVNGGKQYQLASSNEQGTRWGMRLIEDLGGGLSTIAVIENSFNVVNGKMTAGNLFGGQSFVGLSSSRLGTVMLGRQYTSVTDYTSLLAVSTQWATYYGDHPGDLDNMNNTNRINNAIKYASPNFGGLTFGGAFSLGGIAGDFNRNQIWSLGAAYSNGPFSAGVAFLHVEDPNFSFFGNNAASSTMASNMSVSTVYSGYASAKTQQIFSSGIAYAIGRATIGATYSNTSFKDLGAEPGLNPSNYSGSAYFHNVEASFKFQVTPTLLAGVAYNYTKGYGVNDVRYNQASLGLDYFLSKRTDVYLVGNYQHASGTDSTGQSARADIAGLSPSSTANQLSTVAGIRHKF